MLCSSRCSELPGGTPHHHITTRSRNMGAESGSGMPSAASLLRVLLAAAGLSAAWPGAGSAAARGPSAAAGSSAAAAGGWDSRWELLRVLLPACCSIEAAAAAAAARLVLALLLPSCCSASGCCCGCWLVVVVDAACLALLPNMTLSDTACGCFAVAAAGPAVSPGAEALQAGAKLRCTINPQPQPLLRAAQRTALAGA